jgi:hypothetical protein
MSNTVASRSISERAVENIAKPDDGERFSRARYFDEVLFGKNWRGWGEKIFGSSPSAAKLVALAISHYANAKRNATYADPLTIAKALGIKHKIVIGAIKGLRFEKHIDVGRRRDGMTDLIPRLRNIAVEFGDMKSAKCGKEFYKRRAKLIERI